MSCTGEPDTRVLLIVTGMTSHLGDRAAGAEKGTANIFAALASHFGDAVPSTRIFTSLAKGIEGPDGKDDTPDGFHSGNVSRKGARIVGNAVNFEHRAVENVTKHKKCNNLEGILGGNDRTWFPQPRELHAHHYLSHENLRTAKAAPKRRVGRSGGAAAKDTILPSTGRDVQVRTLDSVGNGSEKYLTFLDTTFRLEKEERG
jgi:hypothetical protein